MSWYSVKTNYGTATASGEKFNNLGHTAAHKTLKMGTLVRVTNLENGRSKVVRINDRGPYTKGRIIDVAVGLSRIHHLDFHRDGVVDCKVEVLEEVVDS
jgi:rare lipoprotein A